jgi:anti-anti-sigma regulatory factor
VLMNYFVAAESGHRKFMLVGVSDRLRALLVMTKVDQILKLYGSVDEAEAAA